MTTFENPHSLRDSVKKRNGKSSKIFYRHISISDILKAELIAAEIAIKNILATGGNRLQELTTRLMYLVGLLFVIIARRLYLASGSDVTE